MSKFRIGTKVNIVRGNMKNLSGVITESYDMTTTYYRVKIDDKEERVFSEHNLEFENILDMEIESDELSGVLGKWNGFAPDSVNIDNADHFFMEMAEIYPKYNDDHNIKRNRFKVSVVQGGEGPVPHVHVYFEHKDSKQDVAYICLGSNEYSPQHDKETKILNSQERKALVKFFNTFQKGVFISSKDGNPIPANCWQECVDIWIKTYRPEDPTRYFEVDEETGLYIMPDYSEIHFPKSKKTNAKTESTESGDIMNENILDMEIDDYDYFTEMSEMQSYIEAFLESGNRRDKKDDCVTEIGLAIEHLLKLKYCTNDRNYRVWWNSFSTHIGAFSSYARGLSKKDNEKLMAYVKSNNLQRSYEIGVKNYKHAAKKYPDLKDGEKYIPTECKWSLDDLINPNVTLEELLAKLPDME